MKHLSLLLAALVCAQLFTAPAMAEREDEIRNCLHAWGKTPFTDKSDYRVVSAAVKVMGIGGNITESNHTSKPEHVLVRPSVSVMSKAKIFLENPNGWYCLKGKTTVLGKTEIHLDCHAHLASSDGATVLGGSDEQTGTTVLGATRIIRTGSCEKK